MSRNPRLRVAEFRGGQICLKSENLFTSVKGCCELSAWLFGYPFLTTHTGHLNLPIFGETHLPSAAVFDLGVFAVVVGGTMLILTALSHQSIRRTRRPIAGEDGEAGLPEGDAGHRGTGDDTLTSS